MHLISDQPVALNSLPKIKIHIEGDVIKLFILLYIEIIIGMQFLYYNYLRGI